MRETGMADDPFSAASLEPQADRLLNGRCVKKSILVVEQDGSLRSLLADILEAEGYSVIEASDDRQGWRLAELRQPDVMLADLGSPGAPRRGEHYQIKVGDRVRTISITMLSGYGVLVRQEGSYMAIGVVQKPFDLDTLLTQVARAASS
jgi:DNA-binding response OmpR family regulator